LEYLKPVGVERHKVSTYNLITTQEGGVVALDQMLMGLWQSAHAKSLNQILTEFTGKGYPREEIRVAIACLAEAGLLIRKNYDSPSKVFKSNSCEVSGSENIGNMVSIILVSHNSGEWLEACILSILCQTYHNTEIIVVDNASQDHCVDSLENAFPDIQVIRLLESTNFAHALNCGIKSAKGSYYLFLNPDVTLEKDAVIQLLEVIGANPLCAAAAAKLKLSWAPGFINGLGNFVGAFSWGTDIGLGHLDLGQFDHWDEIPSACFAAALVPASVMNSVGLIDEGFFLYYEDSEWCYRARLFGYTIHAAPRAIAFHAFSGKSALNLYERIPNRKLKQVIYGRLRFISLVFEKSIMWIVFCNYLIEDIISFVAALFRGKNEAARAYWDAWKYYKMALPEIKERRRTIQERRRLSDKELLASHRQIPPIHLWNGIPLLTWDIVQNDYLPWLSTFQANLLPELSENNDPTNIRRNRDIQQNPSFFSPTRLFNIYRFEGPKALIFRIARFIQWKMMRISP